MQKSVPQILILSMTNQEIISLLTADFYERFAEQSAGIITGSESMEALFELLQDTVLYSCLKKRGTDIDSTNNYLMSISREELRKTEFRAAYVMEYIYFSDIRQFEPYYGRFFRIFPLITNESVKRHFTKIMAHILSGDKYHATDVDCDAVATACVDWIINKKVKVAVQIWAIECLFILQHRVVWVKEILDDILQNLSVNPSPAMIVRLRRWRV
ncbi:MAG: hypothetical protein PHT25_04555 [Bacteroidales bacterium]|nr:hypothetical protein [Bacteroidales bacterium]